MYYTHTEYRSNPRSIYKHKRAGKKEESSPSGTHPPRDVGGGEKKAFYYMDLSVAADMRQFITIA